MSAVAVPAEPALSAPAPAAPPQRLSPAPPPGRLARWWPALAVAGVLCFAAFEAGGGLRLSRMTVAEMTLTLGSGLVIAVAVLAAPAGVRSYGLWPAGLLIAFAALTAVSIVWSVQPDDSFRDAGRMLAYSAFFAASVALVRAAAERWQAVLAGVALAAVVVCAYALATKVFPGQLDAGDVYARLRAPYSYWNAIGLTAAMGAICCLWLGSRRTGHGVVTAMAYPAMGLMLVTLMLAYSRGALLALAAGAALWFAVVPLRLRGAAVLVSGAIAAAGVVAFDFSTHALSSDNVALSARASAGHRLGALLVAMVVVLAAAGLGIGFFTGRHRPSQRTRWRAGAALLGALALALVAFCGALAVSHRGLTGSVSHALHALTNPNASVPNTPGRLTGVASVRARYWKEAVQVFEAHPALGAGAEGYATARLRYRSAPISVRQAHGFVVQTLADLGLVGLLVAVALLWSWMAAAGRCTHPFNRRWRSFSELRDALARRAPRWPAWRRLDGRNGSPHYSPERIGMLTMMCVVGCFGVHSLVDWTWYIPGDACVALLCAGWLAGRGPLEGRPRSRRRRPRAALAELRVPRFNELSLRRDAGRGRADLRRPVVAGAAVVATVLAAWTQWQPQRSIDASQQALASVASSPASALRSAQAGVSRDPLSEQALFTLATVQRANGHTALGRATLQRAVRLQPSNPQTWLALGEYDLSADPKAAAGEIAAAIYLNPQSISPEAIAKGDPEAIMTQNAYIEALRASTPASAAGAAAPGPGGVAAP